MIQENKVIVIDIDGTLCSNKTKEQNYADLQPNNEVVEKLRDYKENGFYIIILTSRNMRTHEGNIGKINIDTAKIILKWLDVHKIPYDELHYGRPWCGFNGFYVDDKTIRPDEFVSKDYNQIMELLNKPKKS